MKLDFWKKRWEDNNIKFHLDETNELILKYFNRLEQKKGNKIFIPLCGKTLDIKWLLENGYNVVGSELSKIAVNQLFENLKLKPTIIKKELYTIYISKNINIFVGDIFNLSYEDIGDVDMIYDRCSIVALPKMMREKYASLLVEISKGAKQLIISYEYNQSLMDGPPFSVVGEELNNYYKKTYDLELLEIRKSFNFEKMDVKESIWLLKNKVSKY